MPVDKRAARAGDLFADLGPRSRASVAAFLSMWATPNVDATLVLQASKEPGKPPEITLHTGLVTVSVDTWKIVPRK